MRPFLSLKSAELMTSGCREPFRDKTHPFEILIKNTDTKNTPFRSKDEIGGKRQRESLNEAHRGRASHIFDETGACTYG
jgi:hypothetical protein